MNKPAKETWEKLASEAKKDEATGKMIETLDSIDKALKTNSSLDEEDRGFRLPYSSRPKALNGRWK